MISNFKVEKSTSYECIINQWSRNWSRPDQQADKIRLHDTNTIRMEIHTNTCYSGVFINADFNPFKHVRCSVLPCIVSVILYVPNTQLHKGERERGRDGLVKGGGLPSGVMFTVWPCCPRRKVASYRRGQKHPTFFHSRNSFRRNDLTTNCQYRHSWSVISRQGVGGPT